MHLRRSTKTCLRGKVSFSEWQRIGPIPYVTRNKEFNTELLVSFSLDRNIHDVFTRDSAVLKRNSHGKAVRLYVC